MSRHWSHFKEYHCANDCRQTGCPGHRMRLVYVNTSDQVIVQIDPTDDDVRRCDPEQDYIFDDEQFDTMHDIHTEMIAKWKSERDGRTS